MTLTDRLNAYEKLMRLDKPIGILLLLWPTLWALWLSASGHPNWLIVWIFVMGTVLMRSAGCVVNDYIDRDIDPHVARTQNRPLAVGLVSKEEALALATTLALLAFLLILPLNRLTLMLSVVALLLAATYPFTKRFFVLPQAYLGIAFGMGIPMAYAAQTGRMPSIAWALLIANVFWAMAYDTEYAMVDREDDLKIGIKTSALTFGKFDVIAVMASYSMMFAILIWVGVTSHLHWPFFLGLAVAAGLTVYHYQLIKGRDREQCFKAFLHNNWVGAAIFAGIVLDFLLRR
jgi:4-hydroxybenzoate polyprenyltransferase